MKIWEKIKVKHQNESFSSLFILFTQKLTLTNSANKWIKQIVEEQIILLSGRIFKKFTPLINGRRWGKLSLFIFHFRSESLNRCISLMGGEVKKYKSDFETGNDASLPILRTKQSTVTYQASLYHKKNTVMSLVHGT